jgi:hypothetical protein
MKSTLDGDVAKAIADKDHQWATFVAPANEPNWDYCTRCGQKRDAVKNDAGSYYPCRGFIG